MTVEELVEILGKTPEETVKELQVSSFNIPKWSDLLPQYDPLKHAIMNPTTYPPKLDDNNNDDFKRTPLGLQKLAVSRVAQAMFSVPTERIYNYDKDSDLEQKAVDILEQIYRVHNYIDSENIERAKKLNTSCQIVTIWKVFEQENIIEEEAATLKITHTTYSEIEGYQIFAQVDDNGILLVVSLFYKDINDVEHLDVYVNGEKPQYIAYAKIDKWAIDAEKSNPNLEVFPVVYAYLLEPVWGGKAGTILVEQLEEMESYQGLYIKRNALPTFTMDYGETDGNESTTEESSSDSRRIIKVGKGGKMLDVTWKGANEAITSRYNRIRNAFFEQVQMPDTSFANMITSNTSAENKELLFADAKAKARDLGGEWEKLFLEELTLLKKMAGIIFPKFATIYEGLSIRSNIRPYSIKSKIENAEYVSLGGDSMSLETKVRILDEVDDIGQEVAAIEGDRGAENNLLL